MYNRFMESFTNRLDILEFLLHVLFFVSSRVTVLILALDVGWEVALNFLISLNIFVFNTEKILDEICFLWKDCKPNWDFEKVLCSHSVSYDYSKCLGKDCG